MTTTRPRPTYNTTNHQLHFSERDLFPDRKSSCLDKAYYTNHDIALSYLFDTPANDNFLDSPELVFSLLEGKLAAVGTVLMDLRNERETRNDLPEAVSAANYSDDSPFAVPYPRGIISRIIKPRGRNALSKPTIHRYSSLYNKNGKPEVLTLANDIAKYAISSVHLETQTDILAILNEMTQLTDEHGLSGVRKQLVQIVRGRDPSLDDNGDNIIRIDALDTEVIRMIKAVNRLGRQAIGDRSLDRVKQLGKQVDEIRASRISRPFGTMADPGNSTVVFNGLNAPELRKLSVEPPERKKVTVRQPTAEKLKSSQNRGDNRDNRRAEDLARRAAEQQQAEDRVRSITEHNFAVLEDLRGIAGQYNQLVSGVYERDKKLLRKLKVLGDDSVMESMIHTFPSHQRETLARAAELYTGLATKSELTSSEDLLSFVELSTELRSCYDEKLNSLLPGGDRYELPALRCDPSRDLLWLDANFEEFYINCISDNEAHVASVGATAIDKVLSLLNRDSKSSTANSQGQAAVIEQAEHAEPVSTATAVESRTYTLSEVKALADEVLNWTVMPSEECTIDNLRKIIDRVQKGEKHFPSPKPTIIDERLEMIVALRDKYDAKLSYSSENMMNDSGNFYFVLEFTQDGKEYAIAENPVYGNATYAIARHLMPLLEGESLLTVVAELSRKSIRSLSGRQIIHREGPLQHDEKIEKTIAQLSAQTLN